MDLIELGQYLEKAWVDAFDRTVYRAVDVRTEN